MTENPIRVAELLAAVQPHLLAIRDHAASGHYAHAARSAAQAAHRLFDLIDHLQALTTEEQLP